MPVTLSAKGQELLDLMPPYYSDDQSTWAVVDSCARELQRLQDRLDQLRLAFFPQDADDGYRLLGLWETLMGLPVEPAGATVNQRRASVLAAIARRQSGSGADWVQNLSTLIGSSAWTHQENFPGSYQLTITIPAGTGYTTGQITALADAITPAHLDLIVASTGGFIVGEGIVGQDAI